MTTSADDATTATAVRIGRFAPAEPTLWRRVRRWLAHRMLRMAMRLFNRLITPASSRRRTRQPAGDEGIDILLTGTFHAAGWVRAHLLPLAAAPTCRQLRIVSTYPIPPIPKVIAVYPPTWLRRLTGDVAARLLMFGAVALRRKPHVIGGFHLLVNALAASILARVIRARSLYFCVGGPLELLDGGVWAENRLFGLMETPDVAVERELIRSVGTFDAVVTMGRSAVRFFEDHHVRTRFHVVPGAIDPGEFCPPATPPATDLILVGRLAEIKRIDVFLQAVALASTRLPGLTATIVGDGELRASLEQAARDLGLDGCVRFAGPQARVSDWLRGARVFVLTSDSEGLALSMMEAMMTGLPVIVSNVGDLGDLVQDGVNGYLVPRRDAAAFAARIVEVLSDPTKRASLSTAARQTALQYSPVPISHEWNRILTEWLKK